MWLLYNFTRLFTGEPTHWWRGHPSCYIFTLTHAVSIETIVFKISRSYATRGCGCAEQLFCHLAACLAACPIRITLAFCCWLCSKKIGPLTIVNCFSLTLNKDGVHLFTPNHQCCVKAPLITESSFVLWSSPSRMLATACWQTDDPHHRLSVLEGVPLEQYALVALAKPSVNTKNKSSGIHLPFFCPSTLFLHPCLCHFHSSPFSHAWPCLWTALTTFHAVIKSTAKWARQRGEWAQAAK